MITAARRLPRSSVVATSAMTFSNAGVAAAMDEGCQSGPGRVRCSVGSVALRCSVGSVAPRCWPGTVGVRAFSGRPPGAVQRPWGHSSRTRCRGRASTRPRLARRSPPAARALGLAQAEAVQRYGRRVETGPVIDDLDRDARVSVPGEPEARRGARRVAGHVGQHLGGAVGEGVGDGRWNGARLQGRAQRQLGQPTEQRRSRLSSASRLACASSCRWLRVMASSASVRRSAAARSRSIGEPAATAPSPTTVSAGGPRCRAGRGCAGAPPRGRRGRSARPGNALVAGEALVGGAGCSAGSGRPARPRRRSARRAWRRAPRPRCRRRPGARRARMPRRSRAGRDAPGRGNANWATMIVVLARFAAQLPSPESTSAAIRRSISRQWRR